MVRKPPKPFWRMSFVAASSNCLRVVSLRSAWVRRVAYFGSAEESRRDRSFCRGAGACSIPGLRWPAVFGSLEFDIDTFFNDFDREGFQCNRTRHASGLAAGDIERAEMPGALDDFSGQDAFLRQRRFAMRAKIGRSINRSIDVVDGKGGSVGHGRGPDFGGGKGRDHAAMEGAAHHLSHNICLAPVTL